MTIKPEQSEPTSNKEFFFPKMNKKVTGVLQLESMNNLLVLNFTARDQIMGTLIYTYSEDLMGKNSNEELEVINTNCSAITFYMPGEITFDQVNYALELKVNCSTVIKNELKSIYISIPVMKDAQQSKFFEQLTIPDKATLPLDITINTFHDLLDPFVIIDTVYRYIGWSNFPPCANEATWFAIKRPLKISEKTYDALWNLLDLKKNPTGNSRSSFDKGDDTILKQYYNQFS